MAGNQLICKIEHKSNGHLWRCPFSATTSSQLSRHKLEHSSGLMWCPTCATFVKGAFYKHLTYKSHLERKVWGEPWEIANKAEDGMNSLCPNEPNS